MQSPNEYASQICTGITAAGPSSLYILTLLHADQSTCTVRSSLGGVINKAFDKTITLEKGLLYPLIRANDIKQWQADSACWIVLPYTSGHGTKQLSEQELQDCFPLTWAFFLQKSASMTKRTEACKSSLPAYKNIDEQIFARTKVGFTGKAGKICAAVFGTKLAKPFIPWKTNYLSLSSEDEAHFICGVLNAAILSGAPTELPASRNKKSDLLAMLQHIKLPRYNTSNMLHREISSFSKHAHSMVDLGMDVEPLQADLNKAVEEIWSAN